MGQYFAGRCNQSNFQIANLRFANLQNEAFDNTINLIAQGGESEIRLPKVAVIGTRSPSRDAPCIRRMDPNEIN